MRRLIVETLLAAALWATLVLVLLPGEASPGSTGLASTHDAVVYSRGWLDAAAPPGVFSVSAVCRASSVGYVCVVRDTSGHCHKAILTGFGYPGPLAPSRCGSGLPA